MNKSVVLLKALVVMSLAAGCGSKESANTTKKVPGGQPVVKTTGECSGDFLQRMETIKKLDKNLYEKQSSSSNKNDVERASEQLERACTKLAQDFKFDSSNNRYTCKIPNNKGQFDLTQYESLCHREIPIDTNESARCDNELEQVLNSTETPSPETCKKLIVKMPDTCVTENNKKILKKDLSIKCRDSEIPDVATRDNAGTPHIATPVSAVDTKTSESEISTAKPNDKTQVRVIETTPAASSTPQPDESSPPEQSKVASRASPPVNPPLVPKVAANPQPKSEVDDILPPDPPNESNTVPPDSPKKTETPPSVNTSQSPQPALTSPKPARAADNTSPPNAPTENAATTVTKSLPEQGQEKTAVSQPVSLNPSKETTELALRIAQHSAHINIQQPSMFKNLANPKGTQRPLMKGLFEGRVITVDEAAKGIHRSAFCEFSQNVNNITQGPTKILKVESKRTHDWESVIVIFAQKTHNFSMACSKRTGSGYKWDDIHLSLGEIAQFMVTKNINKSKK